MPTATTTANVATSATDLSNKPFPRQQRVRIAILGAGMSGLCMAIQLRKRGITDFIVLEKADSVGGTWRENTYPNIACDVPSHVYSFSFELNPDWSHSYSGGQEIWEYCNRCVEKYGLAEYIHYKKTVTNAAFDGDLWQVSLADGANVTADVVVSGLGGLHLPNHADIPGLDDFKGTRFHTANWNHDHDLTGRKVAMIGTGASAGQALPGIAPDVESVTVFQRSAAWVFPRLAQDIPAARRSLFKRHPWLMRLYRWYLWGFMDLMGILALKRGGPLAKRLKRAGLDHLANSVDDPTTRAALTPDYEPGCKRRVISDDYLSTFNRQNTHLVTCGIERIEANGVRDANGELHEVDTLIEATGFRPFDITDYVTITGRDGQSLQDVWSDKVSALRTMMVPGFPNFFMMLGPNSATGHTSALIMIESTVNYVINCLEFMNSRAVTHLDPDPDEVSRYNARLQKDLRSMIFSGGCGSWYTDDKDFNFTLWPYSAARFVWEQARVEPKEFGLASDGQP